MVKTAFIERMGSRRKLNWEKYPIRECRSLHHCELCAAAISLGERYRDGGYGRRAHELCVQYRTQAEGISREPVSKESDPK